MTHQVLLFYKYVSIQDPELLKEQLRDLAVAHSLVGRILIAEEGINGTVEGEVEQTEQFASALLSYSLFKDMNVKRSVGTGDSFPKLSVKVREEIVGTKFDKKIDPTKRTGKRLSAEELRTWYEEQRDFVVVDMRNDYEYQSGHFKDSINPGLENSRDLPKALPKLESLKDKTVLTVCTGGIRCEKMSAFLLEHGFEDVYQLENGIHSYMEKFPGKDFEGALYTFDRRKTMDFGGDRTVVGVCHLCSETTELYVNCKNDLCHLHFLACESCQSEEGTYCSESCKTKVATA
ncbi:rhodanese-related sulfurtransferase [Patescibacteria group bacterium]|nr:rhodanese-related sulfurtransferase [Patescibacteria group bacterium]MBU1500957.1 rhodanese-related sulfurtransferase [Patescibacteria group bacterium]MBU2080587.1 rhodanese-related sulfurtransferase [Patescibacteria group bacterium]MBU2124337.1 rhodanese-related sulfurtransferase [Patescibacteria group bacterium]MBU2194463.1 rhodanese-related sulfurtransferase [Patescibacteria group bacterium]